MVMLQSKETKQLFCVANLHLFWNPDRPDLKAAQTAAALDAVCKFYAELGYVFDRKNNTEGSNNMTTTVEGSLPTVTDNNSVNKKLPVLLLCGDFNTMPSLEEDENGCRREAPFELLAKGSLLSSHPEHPDTFYSHVEMRQGEIPTSPRLGSFSTGWKLRNAYELSEFQSQQPLFTTKTDDFQGWIDHIWVSSGVKVEWVLSPPIRSGDLEANRKNRIFPPIPNKKFPSDHLPIGIVFKINN